MLRFFIFGLRVECEGRPLWNWQVWDLGLANHGDCMEEVDPGLYDVYSRATWYLVVPGCVNLSR